MIVVTGGAGFIGSNLVAGLEDRGYPPVVVCDRLGTGDKWLNLAKRELADLVSPEQLFAFLDANRSRVEIIVHMGAVSDTTETDCDKVADNNFRLSRDLWQWCSATGARLIYASSAATYGDGGEGFDDDAAPAALARLRPLNPYGWSKHLFDRFVARRVAEHKPAPTQWAGLKFFNVYGPNEYHKGGQQSVAAHLFPRAAAGESARLFQSHRSDFADGGQKRDFVWVGDCVDVICWLIDNPRASGLYNCGTGDARTFNDLAHAVYHALGKEARITYVPTPEAIRERYQYYTQASMERLYQAGYPRNGFTTLEDGVTHHVQGYLGAPDRYR